MCIGWQVTADELVNYFIVDFKLVGVHSHVAIAAHEGFEGAG
jgi:hypothetical protein